MARLDSLLKFKGSVDDLTVRKTKNGHAVYKKVKGATKEDVATKKNYARVRENLAEMDRAAEAARLFTMALNDLTADCTDTGLQLRMASKMMEVLLTDPVSDRGQRQVMNGDIGLFKDFSLNRFSSLRSIFNKPVDSSIDRVSGKLQLKIPAFIPVEAIKAPAKTSHIKIHAAAFEINFSTGVFVVKTVASDPIPVQGKDLNKEINFELDANPNSTNPLFLVMGIRFYQEVNGKFYQFFEKASAVLFIADAV